MDENGHRENGRQKDIYKAAQSQWLLQHQPSMKQIMSVIAERDAAIQERNMALNEKNKALEERDMVIMQRGAAIRERNEAILERDNALAALQYQQNGINDNKSQGVKHMLQPQLHSPHQQPQMDSKASYNAEQITVAEVAPLTVVGHENPKAQKVKQPKETKTVSPNKKSSKPSKKAKIEGDGSNKGNQEIGGSDALDESNMPTPVCSCTGVYRLCYKWGNGGWQSACCTTTMSMYPLPPVPNKKHARVGGRKMSGSAFSKLMSRIVAEGHDLSSPVDLKEHWAKHGTNRYITIR